VRRRWLNLLWLLLPLTVLGAVKSERLQMLRDIEDGSILAWAEHITGQDPNDLTSFDKFESVAIIPGTSNRADGTARFDEEVWVVVKRTVDGNEVRYIEQFQSLDWGDDPNYCWFVDCAGRNSVSAGTPEVPAVPPTYKFTYLSEVGVVWGIPVSDRTFTGLDVGGTARQVDAATVALPFAGHPFKVGDLIFVGGTTNYNSNYTIQAGTTANEIYIDTTLFVAETFVAGSTVVKKLIVPTGNGGMVSDGQGHAYLAHDWLTEQGTSITKLDLETDTLSYDAINWTGAIGDGLPALRADISSDGRYLYVGSGYGSVRIQKFDLTTGALVWNGEIDSAASLDVACDAAGNAYLNRSFFSRGLWRCNAADGTYALVTNQVQDLGYATVVDNDLGIVVVAGQRQVWAGEEATLYNVGVARLDGSVWGTILLGDWYHDGTGMLSYSPLVASECLVLHEGYIYVLLQGASGALYQLQWTGTSLVLVKTVAAPASACGLYVDAWGNLVVVKQEYGAGVDDVLQYYDTDLNYLGEIANLPTTMAFSWDSPVGGNYIRGNAIADGDLGTPGVPAVPGYNYVVPQLDTEAVCVYADAQPRGTFTVDGNDILDFNEADYNVVIAGLNYFSIFETTPLRHPITLGRPTAIQNVSVNFHETDGVHVGADMEHSSDWNFFRKDFLMKDAPARDANGTTGLPYSGTPFTAGDEVYIYGTTNYDGVHTLAADTNNVELRLTGSYTAETFDGTEWVVLNEHWEPWDGWKGPAPFLRGMSRSPSIYLWEWDPIPLTIRSITANMEITAE
jgi:hypothetical protein